MEYHQKGLFQTLFRSQLFEYKILKSQRKNDECSLNILNKYKKIKYKWKYTKRYNKNYSYNNKNI